ncbi:MAG: vitamin K epoxide reductase family protein [Gammaproteobacteria bacterium]|nr:vitamin K epoxide reductase family protein [Gammaproteobacteria bacterium]
MSKKKKPRQSPAKSVADPVVRAPRPLREKLIVCAALAGMLLTAILSGVAFQKSALPYCPAGSGCDVVQNSRWSTLLGLPLAVWGFGLYAVVAATAFFENRPVARWKRLTFLVLAGLAISVYLTVTVRLSLHAFCLYCLASLGLWCTLAALVFPAPAPGFERWRLGAGAAALMLVTALHLHYSGLFDPAAGPEDPRLAALAGHLEKTGAKFYGAYWCPHCQQQKALFAAAAKRLPYVECSPNGPGTPQATDCQVLEIRTYPTWIISGHRFERAMPPDQLAQLSGFAAPESH